MKTIKKLTNKNLFIYKLIFLLPFLLYTNIARSQERENEDKTLSPYFFINSEDPETDKLPLKETSAKVNIAGVIADVRITQVYKNEGNNPIEAIYVFPASTRAAVYYMKMTIGEREIIALIREKDKARQEYEAAKNEGKSASLLEQERPNVFQMNVANIMPGDIIKVEMSYTELLIPEGGIYEFVYPTVVGPRYSNQSENDEFATDRWVQNPYTHEGEAPLYTFDIEVKISSGIPINIVRSISHDVNITYDGPKFSAPITANVTLKDPESYEGNRDFIIQYRLMGDQIESGLLLFKGEKENFFLAMIQPPKQVIQEIIPPREYVFIVDVSGSMYGFPLDISKKLLKDLIGKLRPSDRFNVVLFASSSSVLSEHSLPATEGNINKALILIDNQGGGGGTELLPALKRALALKGTEDYSRTFIIVTDGYVTVEKEAFELIRKNLSNANFFPFGIGSSVNRYLLEGMAHVGMGESFIITDPGEASEKADKFRNLIQNPVLTNIKIEYKGFEVYDVEPLSIPDVLAERPVILFGKYKGEAKGEIILTGRTGKGTYSKTINVSETEALSSNSAIKYLWAREKVRLLDDFSSVDYYNEEHKEKITEIGLKYNLLTNYTSFIAIDSEIRNNTGDLTTVKQPLPLPDGVSNYAVGGVSMTSVSGNAGRSIFGLRKSAKASAMGEMAYEAENDELYVEEDLIVIEMPEFTGGADALDKFIKKNLQYPAELAGSGITGIVFLSFIVDENGNVKDIKIIKSINLVMDKEAIRIIKLTDNLWIPGKENGEAVAIEMFVPVKFTEE